MSELKSRIKTPEKITKPNATDLRDAVIEVYQKKGKDYYSSKKDSLGYKVSDIKDNKTGLLAIHLSGVHPHN